MANRARSHLSPNSDPTNFSEFGPLADGFEAAVVVLPANNLPKLPDKKSGTKRKGTYLEDKRTWGEKKRKLENDLRRGRENCRFEMMGSIQVSVSEVFVAAKKLSLHTDEPRASGWSIAYGGNIAARFVAKYRDNPRELYSLHVARVLPLLGEGATGVGLTIADALSQLGGFERVVVPFSCVCRAAVNQGDGTGLLRRDDFASVFFVEDHKGGRFLGNLMGRRLTPSNQYQWHFTMVDIDTPSYRIGVNRHLVLASPVL